MSLIYVSRFYRMFFRRSPLTSNQGAPFFNQLSLDQSKAMSVVFYVSAPPLCILTPDLPSRLTQSEGGAIFERLHIDPWDVVDN